MNKRMNYILVLLGVIILGVIIVFIINRKEVKGIYYNYYKYIGENKEYYQRQLFRTNEGKCHFISIDNDGEKQNNVIHKNVDDAYCGMLIEIVNNNNLTKWLDKNWDNSIKVSHDGDDKEGFILTIVYSDGLEKSVDGQNEYPNNYEKVSNELKKLFSSIN